MSWYDKIMVLVSGRYLVLYFVVVVIVAVAWVISQRIIKYAESGRY